MDRDTARAEIQQTLGFRTDKATEIVTALQNAQVMLEREPTLPWFLQTEVSNISTTKDEERIVIPSDFLREWEEDPLWYFTAGTGGDDDAWVALAKEDLAFLRDKYPGSAAPIAYALDVKYFRLFPTPDAVYTIKMIYFATDTVLSSNVENDWLKYFPFLMIGVAGGLIAAALRDKEALSTFSRWAAEGRARLIVETEARISSSRRYVMGGVD